MYDLDRQLSDLASFIDGEVEPVTVSEVVTEKASVAHRPRRAGLSLVFAVLVAVAIGVVIVVAPLGDQEPGVVDEPAPTVVSTTPTLPAEPVVEPTVPQGEEGDASAVVPTPAYTWIRVDDPDLGGEGNQSINSIRAVRSGLMAVGSDNDQPAIWYSDDGLDWIRLEDTTGAFGPEYSPYGLESELGLNDIADNGSRMVAIGVDLHDRPSVDDDMRPDVKQMAFWHSDDGVAWTRVPHHDDLFGMSPGFLNKPLRVVTTGTGFMAVGEAIWTSPDGATWTRQEAPGPLISDVLVTDTGILLVGAAMDREAAWHSTDGTAWSAAGVETEPAGEHRFNAVLETPEGYIAMGSGANRLAWFSPDGFTWTYRGSFSENDGYAYDATVDIAAIGETVVAVGVRWPHVGSGATIWLSSDGGYTWTVNDDPEFTFGIARSPTGGSNATTILDFEGRFVVGGNYGNNDDDGDAAVWIGNRSDS